MNTEEARLQRSASHALAVLLFLGVLAKPAQAAVPCLDHGAATEGPTAPNYAFDSAYDEDKRGESFSCFLQMRASEARDAIESFRAGVLYGDQTRMDRVLGYPLRVGITKTLDVTEEAEIVTVRNFQDWSRLQAERMDKAQIAMIACAHLRSVEIVGGRAPGFMIGDGMIWFTSYVGSPRVYVFSVNLSPTTPDMLHRACDP